MGEPRSPDHETQRKLLAKAMADPVRSEVLSTVAEVSHTALDSAEHTVRSRGVTVRQIAERIAQPRRRVRYHLDALRKDGIVDVAEERRHKGVVERYFVAVRLPILLDDDVADLPPEQQRKLLIIGIKAIFSDVSATLRVPGLAVRRSGWGAARVVGQVDEQGWKELSARHVEFALETQRIVGRSQDRLNKSAGNPIRVISANLLLETPSLDPSE